MHHLSKCFPVSGHCHHQLRALDPVSIFRTIAPGTAPCLRACKAEFASRKLKTVVSVLTGTRGAMESSSSPSRAREVCHAPHGPFAPQNLVGKRRNVRHVDAAAHNNAAFCASLSAAGKAARRARKVSLRQVAREGSPLNRRPRTRRAAAQIPAFPSRRVLKRHRRAFSETGRFV